MTGNVFMSTELSPNAVCIATHKLHAGKQAEQICSDERKWFISANDQPVDVGILLEMSQMEKDALPTYWDVDDLALLFHDRMVMPSIFAIYFDAETSVTSLLVAPGLFSMPIFVNIPATGATNIVYHDCIDQAIETPLKPLAIMEALPEDKLLEWIKQKLMKEIQEGFHATSQNYDEKTFGEVFTVLDKLMQKIEEIPTLEETLKFVEDPNGYAIPSIYQFDKEDWPFVDRTTEERQRLIRQKVRTHKVFRKVGRGSNPRAEMILGVDLGTRRLMNKHTPNPQVLTIITHLPYDEPNAAFDATEFGQAFARASKAKTSVTKEVINTIMGHFNKFAALKEEKERKAKEEQAKREKEAAAKQEAIRIKAEEKKKQKIEEMKLRKKEQERIKAWKREQREKREEEKLKQYKEDEKKREEKLKRKAKEKEDKMAREAAKKKTDKENIFIRNENKPTGNVAKKTTKKKKSLKSLYKGVKK